MSNPNKQQLKFGRNFDSRLANKLHCRVNKFDGPRIVVICKLLVIGTATSFALLGHQSQVEAGFFTFYFPNIIKPKGFGELSDMIHSLNGQINETRDIFSDTQYFWGQMQRLDQIQSEYPEESVCSEIFPMFRDLAIAYVYADYEHYIKPFELYREHLIARRAEWYPSGLDSKAALPRAWEQNLHETELELKIEWLQKLATTEAFKSQREKLVEIWKNVKRSLDTSLPCIYLRYAYRQIAEDINQMALEANLESMQEALTVLRSAYKRVDMFSSSDKLIINDIKEELMEKERFTIKS